MMLELPRAVIELRRRHLVTDIQFVTLKTMLLHHITLLCIIFLCRCLITHLMEFEMYSINKHS